MGFLSSVIYSWIHNFLDNDAIYCNFASVYNPTGF